MENFEYLPLVDEPILSTITGITKPREHLMPYELNRRLEVRWLNQLWSDEPSGWNMISQGILGRDILLPTTQEVDPLFTTSLYLLQELLMSHSDIVVHVQGGLAVNSAINQLNLPFSLSVTPDSISRDIDKSRRSVFLGMHIPALRPHLDRLLRTDPSTMDLILPTDEMTHIHIPMNLSDTVIAEALMGAKWLSKLPTSLKGFFPRYHGDLDLSVFGTISSQNELVSQLLTYFRHNYGDQVAVHFRPSVNRGTKMYVEIDIGGERISIGLNPPPPTTSTSFQEEDFGVSQELTEVQTARLLLSRHYFKCGMSLGDPRSDQITINDLFRIRSVWREKQPSQIPVSFIFYALSYQALSRFEQFDVSESILLKSWTEYWINSIDAGNMDSEGMSLEKIVFNFVHLLTKAHYASHIIGSPQSVLEEEGYLWDKTLDVLDNVGVLKLVKSAIKALERSSSSEAESYMNEIIKTFSCVLGDRWTNNCIADHQPRQSELPHGGIRNLLQDAEKILASRNFSCARSVFV